ncbi:MAG TPA: alpha/beta hydrolase [Porticoccaceae bacterium]|jgi:non-heme chloroperoxidase|nr:alpha/beta hydrolase [Porticoccaceae bacterium]
MKSHYFLTLLLLLVFNNAQGSEGPLPLAVSFDSLGPTVHQLKSKDGRLIHYIDDGEENAIPVVFTGGLGTSVRAIRLLDFLRTMRRSLNLRFITVERNGYGQTAFNPMLGMADYVEDVEQVLAHLNISNFSLFGISGGGPYTAKIAEKNYRQLLSIHMAATSPLIDRTAWCAQNKRQNPYRDLLAYPMQFFGFPSSSSVHQLIGFQDTAFDEAARAHNIRGQSADPAPLDHEIALYCKEDPINAANINTKVFVYRGLADSLLSTESTDIWSTAYPNAEVILRHYPGEGHDVQYRHLDQILLDIAHLNTDILVCQDGSQKFITPSKMNAELSENEHLGLCVWQ